MADRIRNVSYRIKFDYENVKFSKFFVKPKFRIPER